MRNLAALRAFLNDLAADLWAGLAPPDDALMDGREPTIMVPAEPTPEMLSVGYLNDYGVRIDLMPSAALSLWQRMLAAAPTRAIHGKPL